MQKTYLRGAMGAVVACSWLCFGAANASTTYYDLTQSPSSTQSADPAVLNGGIFRTPAADGDLGKGTIVGTGVFQPFVRIQETANGSTLKSNGIESGFNTGDTSATKLLDDHDKGGSNWNHAIKLSDVPMVTVCDGGGTTGTNCQQYYEFLLDINEPDNSNSGLSLDEFKLFWAGSGDLSSYTGADDTSGFTNFNITGATLAYNMDAGSGGDSSIYMDYSNFSGSGNGVDLQALVPVTNLADSGATGDSYLYLYSKFGAANSGSKSTGKTKCKAGDLNMMADAGFEEWSIRKHVPLPPTALLFGLGFAALIQQQRRSQRKSS